MLKSKKVLIILGCFFVLILAVFAAMFINAGRGLAKYKNFDYGSLDLSAVEDGTYTGSEDGSLVSASVEVTVKDHIITDVKILSHKNGKGKPAEVIVDDIVKKNSLEVDAISGATYSSYVLKKAVYNALAK